MKTAKTSPKTHTSFRPATLINRLLLFTLLLAASNCLGGVAIAQPADTIETFPVGGGPNALAFDGANIWVTNGFDATVTKIIPSRSGE